MNTENSPARPNPPLSISIPPIKGAALVPDKTNATGEAANLPELSVLARHPKKIGMMAVGSVAKIGTTKKNCHAESLVDSAPVAIESAITKIKIGTNARTLVPIQPAIKGRTIPTELPTINT